ncbi:MAG: hypothetical protein Q8M40_07545 [Legionella sp.]|nr:hypothetical protein [Legionella sp.]
MEAVWINREKLLKAANKFNTLFYLYDATIIQSIKQSQRAVLSKAIDIFYSIKANIKPSELAKKYNITGPCVNQDKKRVLINELDEISLSFNDTNDQTLNDKYFSNVDIFQVKFQDNTVNQLSFMP